MAHQGKKSLTDFVEELPRIDKALWIGAISFEERCVGSAAQLRRAGAQLVGGLMIDYPTQILPADEGEERRAGNRQRLMSLLPRDAEIRRIRSYRFGALLGALAEVERLWRQTRETLALVVDVTCLTKVHTLALSWWMASQRPWSSIYVAYTRPRDYGSPLRNIWGKGSWLETIVAPFEFSATQRWVGSVGIAVLGHEGDRLRLAMEEVDVEEGIVISPVSDDPRLHLVAEAQNAWLLNDMASGRRGMLRNERADALSMATVAKLVGAVAAEAKAGQKRVVLYPFGPKPVIVGAALTVASVYGAGLWYSYPVPRCYDVNYTSGIHSTFWSNVDP